MSAQGAELVCGFCGQAPEDHGDADAGPMSVCPPRPADTVVWVVETQDDDRYSPWYIDSVHASFASADSRIKRLAAEYPEWAVLTRSFALHNDALRVGDLALDGDESAGAMTSGRTGPQAHIDGGGGEA